MEEGRIGGAENRRVARAAGVVGLATMLSRISGFLRDMVVAAFFGAGLTTDAFFLAGSSKTKTQAKVAETKASSGGEDGGDREDGEGWS